MQNTNGYEQALLEMIPAPLFRATVSFIRGDRPRDIYYRLREDMLKGRKAEAMVMMRSKGSITSQDIIDATGVSAAAASNVLASLAELGVATRTPVKIETGGGRIFVYRPWDVEDGADDDQGA
jgi:hypothetical protein